MNGASGNRAVSPGAGTQVSAPVLNDNLFPGGKHTPGKRNVGIYAEEAQLLRRTDGRFSALRAAKP